MLFLKSLIVPLLAVSTPPPPPAGIVERQIEAEYEAKEIDPEKEIPLLEIDIPDKCLDLGGLSVEVKKVLFMGNNALSSKKLEKAATPFLNRELSMQDLTNLCVAIRAMYAKNGYFLARAYLPEQEIKNGILTVGVLEGKLGNVTVVGNKHYSEKFILGYFKKLQGEAINYDDFLKTLLLLDDNSDLDVGAVFKKGSDFGTADVIVRVEDKRPLHVFIDHNNYGSLHTSRNRSGGRLDLGSLFMYGDTLSIAEVLGSPISSLDFTDVIYKFPINTYGSFLEFSYLLANFKTSHFDNMRFEGRSHIAGTKFTQAIARTRRLNYDVFTSFDYKQIKNLSKVGVTSFDKLRVLALGMNFDYIDGWKGRNLFTLSGAVGIPDLLGGNKAVDPESSRRDAGGRFVKFNGGVKRIQQMPKDFFFLLNGVGQFSFNKLPLPEQIYIGGVDTVRGYKLAVGLGDHGFYANVELRVPPPFIRKTKIPLSKKTWGEFLHFVGFLDHGQTFSIGEDVIREAVETSRGKERKAGVRQDGRAILTAVGAGFRIYGPWKFEFSLDAGYPLTDRHRSSDTITYFKVSWQIL